MIDIVTWSDYVLSAEKRITHLKLQKLLYYLQVWGLVAGTPLIEEPFLKWRHGPVNETIYQCYCAFKAEPLPQKVAPASVSAEIKRLADFILDAYRPLSPYELSDRSHRERPWQDARPNEALSSQSIIQYYKQNDHFAQNFIPNFDPDNRPYYLLRDNGWYSYTMDMSKEDAERHGTISSYKLYKTTQIE